jgi:plastocyanin
VSRFGRIALAALGLAAAAVAACGGGTPQSSGPAASMPAGTYAVEAKDFAFTPSTLSVPAGDVTFRVHNAGTQEHEFEIFQGERVVDEIEGLVPGLTLELTVPAAHLPAGEYTFKYLLNGHDQLGMKGTLTVTGS